MEEVRTSYELVDTHCHLYLEEYAGELDSYLDRAAAAGVRRIYMPSIDKSHFLRMLDVEKSYPGRCFAMAGLHPCYVKENYREELDFMIEAVSQRKFAAIGEIGLDYYWDRTHDNEQKVCFREQISLARSYDLPVVIHSRNSMNETIGVIQEEAKSGVRGIFHCFTGTYENALEVIDCGMYLGIGGVLTYKKSGLDDVVARVPLEWIVLETDAPYLSPVPFRGKRNESSYLKYIVEKIAEVRKMPVAEVAAITTENAKKVFG